MPKEVQYLVDWVEASWCATQITMNAKFGEQKRDGLCSDMCLGRRRWRERNMDGALAVLSQIVQMNRSNSGNRRVQPAQTFFLHDASNSPYREVDVPAEQDWAGPTGASRADSGNGTDPVRRQGCEHSSGDTETKTDESENPEDC